MAGMKEIKSIKGAYLDSWSVLKNPVVESGPVFVWGVFDNGNYFSILMFSKLAPITVEHFRSNVKAGAYDGCSIYDICDTSVKFGKLEGSKAFYMAKKVVGEFNSNGIYNPLAMCQGSLYLDRDQDNNSGDTRVVVNLKADNRNDDYAVFGRVICGLGSFIDAAEIGSPRRIITMAEY